MHERWFVSNWNLKAKWNTGDKMRQEVFFSHASYWSVDVNKLIGYLLLLSLFAAADRNWYSTNSLVRVSKIIWIFWKTVRRRHPDRPLIIWGLGTLVALKNEERARANISRHISISFPRSRSLRICPRAHLWSSLARLRRAIFAKLVCVSREHAITRAPTHSPPPRTTFSLSRSLALCIFLHACAPATHTPVFSSRSQRRLSTLLRAGSRGICSIGERCRRDPALALPSRTSALISPPAARMRLCAHLCSDQSPSFIYSHRQVPYICSYLYIYR